MPGKAAAADSYNSSTAAVYQAAVGAVGTRAVGNQDTVEAVAGVENPHHYTDVAAVVVAAAVVVVGRSSRRIRYHCVAEPMV